MEEPSSEISAKKDVHLKCRTCGREFKGFGGYSQHRCSSSSTPSVVNKVDREEDRLRLQQDLQERWTSKVRSTFLNGLTNLRYEKYTKNSAVQEAKEMFASVNRQQKEAIKKVLLAADVNLPVDSLIDPIMDIASGVMLKKSEHAARLAQYVCPLCPVKRHLGKVGTSVQLGERRICEASDASMYDIPLEQYIQRQLLYDPTFASNLVDWAELPRANDGAYENVQDGLCATQHPVLSQPRVEGAPVRLAFGLYADDVEVVNPIGASRTKHKVTLYYATILNLPWFVRSQLDNMYLVGVVLAKIQQAVGPKVAIQGKPNATGKGVLCHPAKESAVEQAYFKIT